MLSTFYQVDFTIWIIIQIKVDVSFSSRSETFRDQLIIFNINTGVKE